MSLQGHSLTIHDYLYQHSTTTRCYQHHGVLWVVNLHHWWRMRLWHTIHLQRWVTSEQNKIWWRSLKEILNQNVKFVQIYYKKVWRLWYRLYWQWAQMLCGRRFTRFGVICTILKMWKTRILRNLLRYILNSYQVDVTLI